jgi:ankyrin repeat protein
LNAQKSRLDDNDAEKDLRRNELNVLMESNYDTFHVPYGPEFNKKSIEELARQADFFLNSESMRKNQPPERPYHLHRHPCFFGDMKTIFKDCCPVGCPEAKGEEATAMQISEDAKFVRGPIRFLCDDPGRQSIGSFNPVGGTTWYESAYLSYPELLSPFVSMGVLDSVKSVVPETCDVNQQDQVGRTPLYLSALCEQNEIATYLINNGGLVTAHNPDGRTILHLACEMGNIGLLEILLESQKAKMAQSEGEEEPGPSNPDKSKDPSHPDGFLDLNLPDWGFCFTPLHYAIFNGHDAIVERLIAEGASKTQPVSLPYLQKPSNSTTQLVHPMVLAAHPPNGVTIAKHLIHSGVSMKWDGVATTVFHMVVQSGNTELVKFLLEEDPRAKEAINQLNFGDPPVLPIHCAILRRDHDMVNLLLEHGAKPEVSLEQYSKYAATFESQRNPRYFPIQPWQKYYNFRTSIIQPLEVAMIQNESFNPDLAILQRLLHYGASVNSAPRHTYRSV